MARKTSSSKTRNKNKNKSGRTSTTVQSMKKISKSKASDQNFGGESEIHTSNHNPNECREDVCDCIQRRGQMFLPPNLLETEHKYDQIR